MEVSCWGVNVLSREVRHSEEQSVRCFRGWGMEMVSAWIWRQARGREEKSSPWLRRNTGGCSGSLAVGLGRIDNERCRLDGGGR